LNVILAVHCLGERFRLQIAANQGDQIGRIFDYWEKTSVLSAVMFQFLKYIATFKHGKIYAFILTKTIGLHLE
jgi:hypothetical protein